MKNKYDIAAYIWPAYTGDEPRTRMFWGEGIGEWQSVKNAGANSLHYKREWYESWKKRKPLWGYVNEANPDVMKMQIDCAVSHGVNVFIYDWYWYDNRPFLENCLNDGFLKAENSDKMKFYLMWANHDANNRWNVELSDDFGDTVIWGGAVDFQGFKSVVHRVIDNYFSKQNYYKIDGCPVFMIYDVNNLVRGLGGIEKTRYAIEYFRAAVRDAGFPDLHLQVTAWREGAVNLSGFDSNLNGSTKDIVSLLGADSITNYQFVHFVNVDRDYTEIMSDVEREWRRIDEEYTVPYFPHISCGWDNNPRFKRFAPRIVKNNTPENFEKALVKAKEYVDTHNLPAPLITVNSWNEWTETSYLEPDELYGYGYLDKIKKVFLDEK